MKGKFFKRCNGKMFLLMLATLVFIWLIVVLNAGAGISNMSRYIDPPTFLYMAVLAALALMFTGRGKDFCNAFRITFSKRQEGALSRMELQKAITSLQFIRGVVMLEAGIFSLIGGVNLLYNMDDLSALGPALAIALLSFLYAAIFALLMQFLSGKLEGMLVAYMQEPSESAPVSDEQTVYFKLRALGLTDREAEVARLVSCEMTNREIGQMLYISDSTVKKHITHILEKTKQEDREKLTEMIRGL